MGTSRLLEETVAELMTVIVLAIMKPMFNQEIAIIIINMLMPVQQIVLHI